MSNGYGYRSVGLEVRPITDRQNRIKSDHLSKRLSQYIYDEHAAIQVTASPDINEF